MNNGTKRLKAKDERLMELIGTDRDGLVEALKSHGAIIREADEWRPLADHVLALIELALASTLKERKVAKEKLAVHGSTVAYGDEVHRLRGPSCLRHMEDTAPDVYDVTCSACRSMHGICREANQRATDASMKAAAYRRLLKQAISRLSRRAFRELYREFSGELRARESPWPRSS